MDMERGWDHLKRGAARQYGRQTLLRGFVSYCLPVIMVALVLKSHLVPALAALGTVASPHAFDRQTTFPAHTPPLPVPTQQLRAVWIATVSNLDWPARPGLTPVAQQQDFLHKLDEARNLRMNAVVVQVRPSGDAFYPSQYAPWSQYLTGVQGRSPGYDPLAFMLAAAHQRHMAFHAWFNPFRLSTQGDITKLAPNNPARLHPDWVVHYGSMLYLNPGIPAARELVVNSILEVVAHYPVDAVHLDDYFYPYPIAGQDYPDDATYHQYGAAHFSSKVDWRRDNINRFIQELSLRIHALRPGVQLGVSPFGVWRNVAADPTGSQTTAGATDYDSLDADTRTWIRNNWIDYIAPQIYWPLGFTPAAYETLVPWWVHEVQGSRVRLYIGQAAYRIDAWNDPNELYHQLLFNRRYPAVSGSIFFSLKDVLKHASYFKTLWNMK